ncbi:MAG: DUF885 domain-containing protein [Lachnospira sp.]
MLEKIRKSLFYKIIALTIITVLITGSVSGCLHQKNELVDETEIENNLENSAENDSSAFAAFTEQLFRDTITQDSLSLHSYINNPDNFGITSYDVTLGRFDFDNLDCANDYADVLTYLHSFDKNTLSPAQQITYDELCLLYENLLEYSDLYLYNTSLNSTTGIHIQLPLILAEYVFSNENDIHEYITLLEDVDEYFSDIIKYEKLRAAEGIFKEDNIIDSIVTQCKTFISSADDSAQSVLITSFNERLDAFSGLSDADKDTLKAQNVSAIKEHVIPGYQTLIDELTKLKGSCKYAGGLCNSPDGQRYFENLLSSYLGWSKTVDEFNQMLDNAITKYYSEIQMLLISDSSVRNGLSSFSFNMSDPAEILSYLKQQITTDFPEIEDVNYDIKYVSEALSDSASPAMYFIPQLDNLSTNSIYINPNCKISKLFPTLAHEGYPGHLYQTQYFAATNPDWIRYIIAPGGYVEGWASYVELLSYSYTDTGNDAINQVMAYQAALTLCIYAKCDIGVNYYGWTQKEISEFIKKYFNAAESLAGWMYTAFVDMPGNYCKYVLGFLGFTTLRQQAETELGDKFVLKDFHKFVLDMGPVQFDILFKKLPAWIDGRKL